MKSLIVFVLFVGMFLVVSGVYEQRLEQARKEKKIEYRFIPRSMYEEQLANNTLFAQRVLKPIFDSKIIQAYDPQDVHADALSVR
jgi:hypothetical protein